MFLDRCPKHNIFFGLSETNLWRDVAQDEGLVHGCLTVAVVAGCRHVTAVVPASFVVLS